MALCQWGFDYGSDSNWTRTVMFLNVRSSSSWHLKGTQIPSSSAILGLSDWWEWRHYVRVHSSKIAVSHAMWFESSATPLWRIQIWHIGIILKFLLAHEKLRLVFLIQWTCFFFILINCRAAKGNATVNWKVKENVRVLWIDDRRKFTAVGLSQNGLARSETFIRFETVKVNSSLGNSVVIVRVNWACNGN